MNYQVGHCNLVVRFDQKVMQAPAFSLVLIGLLVAAGLAASAHGSVAIAQLQSGGDRVVRITGSNGEQVVDSTRLGSGASQKHLVWTGLFGRTEIWIEVAGSPPSRNGSTMAHHLHGWTAPILGGCDSPNWHIDAEAGAVHPIRARSSAPAHRSGT